MILNSRRNGSGPPLIILHGLFGSADNWRSVAARLETNVTTVTLDLRNHGDSPHADSMSYREMARDVGDTLDQLKIDTAHLLGHSMGGKVAMQFALDVQQRTLSLVAVDIAPRRYPAHHRQILRALAELESAQARSRKQADRFLADYIENQMVRAFLLKSVAAGEDGIYRWKLNAAAIISNYHTISDWPEQTAVYQGPALLLRGAVSDYVDNHGLNAARRWFPALQLQQIDGAGHWVHAERRDQFCDAVIRFLDSDT